MAEGARLRTISNEPFNASTPPEALGQDITPTDLFFVRNHFPVPRIEPDRWRLTVEGGTHGARRFSLGQLAALPRSSVTTTMECAGNGRRRMLPEVPGVPWDDWAVGTARWDGVPLERLLSSCGVPDGTVEVLFQGLDEGVEGDRRLRFERSLPLKEALRPGVLVALRMNGAPLTPDHGAPARLIVPDWYGVASVKWLGAIRFLAEPFTGWFQRDRYVYVPKDGQPAPVDRMLVKALIVSPVADARIVADRDVEVVGRAWSGRAAVARVDVSTDGGATWSEAELESAPRHAAVRFRHRWRPKAPGRHVLVARATDASGDAQPPQPPWNALGYGQNAVVPVPVDIVPEA